MRPRAILSFVAILSCLLWTGSISAEPTMVDPMKVYREAPKVSVLTFGPGDAPFLRFGHNAIRVRDPKTDTDLVYNFGTFRFDSPTLILDFLTGKFTYWLGVARFEPTVAHYKRANRDVIEQELALGPTLAVKLQQRLEENAKPENREYLYDYYTDNCSTRIRDLLDDLLDGALHNVARHPSNQTYRTHTLRTLVEAPFIYLGLDVAMGPLIDQRITGWEDMFLPEQLRQGLSAVTFNGVHGAFQLVKKERVWHRARGRGPIPTRAPERETVLAQASLAWSALLIFGAWESYRRRLAWGRWLVGAHGFVLGVVAGILGPLFCALWAFTNHAVAYHNENILQCAPFALGLAICCPGVVRARVEWTRRARNFAAAGLLLSALGLCLKALPAFAQDNFRIIALMLPAWAGLTLALQLLLQRAILNAQSIGDDASDEPRTAPGQVQTRTEPAPSPPADPEPSA